MLKNVSLKFLLAATMGVMGVMLVVGGAMGLVGLKNTNNALKNVYSVQLASSIAIDTSIAPLLLERLALDRFVLQPNAPGAAKNIQSAAAFRAQSEAAWNAYLALPISPEEKKLSDDVAAKRKIYLRDAANPLIAVLRAGDQAEADRIEFEKMAQLFTPLHKSADNLTEFQMKTAAATYAASQSMYNIFLIMAIVGVVFGLFIVT